MTRSTPLIYTVDDTVTHSLAVLYLLLQHNALGPLGKEDFLKTKAYRGLTSLKNKQTNHRQVLQNIVLWENAQPVSTELLSFRTQPSSPAEKLEQVILNHSL